MDRNITEPHQFFSEAADGTPYFVTWTPDGTMTIRAGDTDFDTWCPTLETFTFLPGVVEHAGLEAWAAFQIGIRHEPHLIEKRTDVIDAYPERVAA